MSCKPENICNYDYGGIVAVALPTIRGYVILKKPSFFIIEYKLECYKQGYTRTEVEVSTRNYFS